MNGSREKYMLLNGEPTLLAPRCEPYVFQNVHTLGGECRRMRRHVEVLASAAEQLFGVDLDLDARWPRRAV